MRKTYTHLLSLSICLAFSMAQNAEAQDGEFDNLILDGTIPHIKFDKTYDQYIVSFDDYMGIYINNGYKIRLWESAPLDALVVDDNGTTIANDLIVPDGAVNIARTDSNPFVNLTHDATSQTFGIRSLSENAGLHGGGIGFSTPGAAYPLWVFETANTQSLSIREEGVGVGTYDANEALHVYSNGFPFDNAKVLVENNQGGSAIEREMFRLVNNGPARFAFEDTDANSTWAFTNTVGAFNISLEGTGGSEFNILPNGRVTMGPGTTKNFDLRSNGNLFITGTLFQSSDRNLKSDFQNIDEEQILEKLANMPVTTWQFKAKPGNRHMGPTSQDFREAFGLGSDDKTIAPIDGIGVSLAAIKALHSEVQEKENKINELNEKVEELENRLTLLDELQVRLSLLEASQNE